MKKEKMLEMRYYEIPQEIPLIALLGERWELNYGSDPMHIHNLMEIGLCYYGEGVMYLENTKREYHAGTITAIPVNSPHRTKSKGDSISKWEYLFVDTDRFLDSEFSDRPIQAKYLKQQLKGRPAVMSEEDQPAAGKALRLILDEMRYEKEYYRESVRGYLLALLLEFVRINPEESEASLKQDGGSAEHIMKALTYIEEHYREELKAGDLAEICHMSESHFRRLFVSCINMPPLEYLALIRIQKACELLTESRESLESIGRKVGFPVTATFIRNFKKIIGVSPGQWRNMVERRDNTMVNYKVSVRRGW